MPRFTILQRPFFGRNSSKRSATSSEANQIVSLSNSLDLSTRSLPPRPNTSSNATLKGRFATQGAVIPDAVAEQRESVVFLDEDLKTRSVLTAELRTFSDPPRRSGSETLGGTTPELQVLDKPVTPLTEKTGKATPDGEAVKTNPALVVQAPTPAGDEALADTAVQSPVPSSAVVATSEGLLEITQDTESSSQEDLRSTSSAISPRHVSVDSVNKISPIITTTIETSSRDAFSALGTGIPALDYFTPGLPNMSSMLHRKIWVRRPGASATLVQIKEDDLVDDVRDMILKKYANSLGKNFDAPDMLLWVSARAEPGQQRSERILGPEEEMGRTIDRYFPGGQTVEDALTIDVPPKRTPRASPRLFQQQAYHQQQQHGFHAAEDLRPMESGNDYFPPMPAMMHPPPLPQINGAHEGRGSLQHPSGSDHQRSISVLSTGQLPPLPSPGGTRRLLREHRPKFNRQHTSSPTIVQHHTVAGTAAVPQSVGTLAPQMHTLHRGSVRPRNDSNASEAQHIPNGVGLVPALPTPPVPEGAPSAKSSAPPTPGSAVGPHAGRTGRPKKNRKPTPEKQGLRARRERNADSDSPKPSLMSSMLDASIPPINVLIVEDNIINLRILEGLMKRLKVRWETAMNGQIAVDKWRAGGFHLVLMDIQMPVMNGLQATKEIRRLEKVNGIGVFSSSAPSTPNEQLDANGNGHGSADVEAVLEASKQDKANDKIPLDQGFFKSPVIIVALTASSLQSDRHEALAAGCNDFLTKPVNYTWLERKVKEWGCMQALIDFDGWRKWKDYAAKEEAGKSEEEKRKEAELEEKQKRKMEKLAILQEKQKLKREQDEAIKRHRQSVEVVTKADVKFLPVEEQVDGLAAPVIEEEAKRTPPVV